VLLVGILGAQPFLKLQGSGPALVSSEALGGVETTLSKPLQCPRGLFVLPSRGELGWPYKDPRGGDGEHSDKHTGIDISGEAGDPIYAVYDGVVTDRQDPHITIYHEELNIDTYYTHMSEVLVNEGEEVKKGQVVGKKGDVGAPNAHLHFSIKKPGTEEWYLENTEDPSPYLGANLNWETGAVAHQRPVAWWCEQPLRQTSDVEIWPEPPIRFPSNLLSFYVSLRNDGDTGICPVFWARFTDPSGDERILHGDGCTFTISPGESILLEINIGEQWEEECGDGPAGYWVLEELFYQDIVTGDPNKFFPLVPVCNNGTCLQQRVVFCVLPAEGNELASLSSDGCGPTPTSIPNVYTLANEHTNPDSGANRHPYVSADIFHLRQGDWS